MIKHQLFREPVPRSGTYVPIEALTPEEQAIHDRLHELSEQVKSLLDEQDGLRNSCKHPAFYDVSGFPYDSRYRAVCGTFLERI